MITASFFQEMLSFKSNTGKNKKKTDFQTFHCWPYSMPKIEKKVSFWQKITSFNFHKIS